VKSADLAVINCEQLLTCRGRIPKRKDSLQDVGILEKGCIASHKGRIVFVGDEKRLKEEVRLFCSPNKNHSHNQKFLFFFASK